MRQLWLFPEKDNFYHEALKNDREKVSIQDPLAALRIWWKLWGNYDSAVLYSLESLLRAHPPED